MSINMHLTQYTNIYRVRQSKVATYFPNDWKILNTILHAIYNITYRQNYKILFSYLQLRQSNAVLATIILFQYFLL